MGDNTKMLSKQDIKQARDRESIVVDVPEWGGSVRLMAISGTEKDAYEASIYGNGRLDTANVRAKLISKCLVDEEGNRLFSETEISDLGNKSGAVLTRLFVACQKLNAIGDQAVDDLAKNS